MEMMVLGVLGAPGAHFWDLWDFVWLIGKTR